MISQDKQDFVSKLALLKVEAMRIGLYRTGHLLEIPLIEAGWDMQGQATPKQQRERQHDTFKIICRL